VNVTSVPRWMTALVVLGLCASLTAQARTEEEIRVELARAQNALEQSRKLSRKLLDARIAHDLGLPLADEIEVLQPSQTVSSMSVEHARRDLRQQQDQTASLRQKYSRMKELVDELRADAGLANSTGQDEWVTVPSPVEQYQATELVVGARPEVEIAPGPTEASSVVDPVRVVSNLNPIQAHIHGSKDHGLVARALFKAGQALMDRAGEMERRGQKEAAIEFDDEASQRLERAIAEIAEATKREDAAYSDLFCLGRCRELLFRIAERRENLSADSREYQRQAQRVHEPFLKIAARDVQVVSGVEVLGMWGRAAQAAMDHFRWMNKHADYSPRADIESITWPGKSQQ
jgi:hypothetical protein